MFEALYSGRCAALVCGINEYRQFVQVRVHARALVPPSSSSPPFSPLLPSTSLPPSRPPARPPSLSPARPPWRPSTPPLSTYPSRLTPKLSILLLAIYSRSSIPFIDFFVWASLISRPCLSGQRGDLRRVQQRAGSSG